MRSAHAKQSRCFPDLADRVRRMVSESAIATTASATPMKELRPLRPFSQKTTYGGRLMRCVFWCSDIWLILSLKYVLNPVANYVFSLGVIRCLIMCLMMCIILRLTFCVILCFILGLVKCSAMCLMRCICRFLILPL